MEVIIFPHCIVFGLNLNLLFVCTPENEHGTGKKNRKGVALSKPPLLDSHYFSIYFKFPGGISICQKFPGEALEYDFFLQKLVMFRFHLFFIDISHRFFW